MNHPITGRALVFIGTVSLASLAVFGLFLYLHYEATVHDDARRPIPHQRAKR